MTTRSNNAKSQFYKQKKEQLRLHKISLKKISLFLMRLRLKIARMKLKLAIIEKNNF